MRSSQFNGFSHRPGFLRYRAGVFLASFIGTLYGSGFLQWHVVEVFFIVSTTRLLIVCMPSVFCATFLPKAVLYRQCFFACLSINIIAFSPPESWVRPRTMSSLAVTAVPMQQGNACARQNRHTIIYPNHNTTAALPGP